MGNCCSLKSDGEPSPGYGEVDVAENLKTTLPERSNGNNVNIEQRQSYPRQPAQKQTIQPKTFIATNRINTSAKRKEVFDGKLSRLNYLLNDPKPIIGQDVPSMAATILRLSNDSIQSVKFHRGMLKRNSSDFITVKNLFTNTTRKHFPVKIELIQNPFLKAFYLLRKEEYISLYGKKNVIEDSLFHGTLKCNLYDITFNNFNWRLHGTATGHDYGMGTSFSPLSSYSSHYCDDEEIPVMILSSVLISKECFGDANMRIPPRIKKRLNTRFDTSIKHNRSVIVKYCDDEFYPQYIIHFKER